VELNLFYDIDIEMLTMIVIFDLTVTTGTLYNRLKSTRCAKKWPNFFCQNFVKSVPYMIIFGTQIAKMIELC